MIWRPIIEGVATWDDVLKRDLYFFLDINEALDVFGDANDLNLRPPPAAGAAKNKLPPGYAYIPTKIIDMIPTES